MSKYGQEQERLYLEKLRELLKELPEFCEWYFTGRANTLAARTQYAYAGDIRTYLRYVAELREVQLKDITLETLENITALELEAFLSSVRMYETPDGKIQENTVQGIRRKFSTLKAFYLYYYKKDLIEKNPTLKVEQPKLHKKNVIRLDNKESEELLSCAFNGIKNTTAIGRSYNEKNGLRNYTIITLLLGTGMRISECVGIDIKDIDFKSNRIQVLRKGGNYSYVYFNDDVAQVLTEYLEERIKIKGIVETDQDALFLSSRKKRISVRNVEIMVKEHSSQVTVKKITPHKLRSTYGTNLYELSGDVLLTSKALNHASIETTSRFYIDSDDKLKDVTRYDTIKGKKNENQLN